MAYPKRYNYTGRARRLKDATERFAFNLTLPQDEWLDRQSIKTGLSKSHLLRSLVFEAMKQLGDDG